jgi:hypothetical protein
MIAALPSRRRLPRNGVRGLGAFPNPNPNGSSSAFVNSMASAIATQEGYGAPNSACTAINNPGCLRAGPGQTGTSAQGFAIFPDPSTGWAALDSQVQYNIGLGLNMQQFFGGALGVYPGYAPAADSNSPNQYAANVASALGVDTSTPLSQLQAAYDGSPTAAGSVAGGAVAAGIIPTVAPITLPDTSGSDTSSTDSGDISSDGGTDYTPYIMVAAVAGLALLFVSQR